MRAPAPHPPCPPPIDGTCACCGAPIRKDWARRGLVIKSNPSEAFWRWKSITTSPTRCRLLRLLAQFGELTNAALMLTLPGEDSGPGALKTQICLLRRDLDRAGAGVTILAMPRQGYRLIWRTET